MLRPGLVDAVDIPSAAVYLDNITGFDAGCFDVGCVVEQRSVLEMYVFCMQGVLQEDAHAPSRRASTSGKLCDTSREHECRFKLTHTAKRFM